MRNARVVYGLARSAVRLECSHLDEKSAFRLCGHLVEFVKERDGRFTVQVAVPTRLPDADRLIKICEKGLQEDPKGTGPRRQATTT
jgi:hypothetical protein